MESIKERTLKNLYVESFKELQEYLGNLLVNYADESDYIFRKVEKEVFDFVLSQCFTYEDDEEIAIAVSNIYANELDKILNYHLYILKSFDFNQRFKDLARTIIIIKLHTVEHYYNEFISLKYGKGN